MTDGPYAPARIRVLPSWLLGRAAARGHQLVAKALARVEIRMMHHAALATVAEQGPVSQAELGRILKVDPKDMSAIVHDLDQRGLVVRIPDPVDRRKNAISLAPAGTRLLRRTEDLGEQANAELTAALTPDEREQLIRLLTRIVSAAEHPAPEDASNIPEALPARPEADVDGGPRHRHDGEARQPEQRKGQGEPHDAGRGDIDRIGRRSG